MDLATLKIRIQRHLTDGLLTIVGSGLSVAEGIPGMTALKDHLLATLPERVHADSLSVWQGIRGALEQGHSLENSLLSNPPDPHLETLIAEETTNLICPAEARVFEEAIAGERVLRFSKLCRHFLKTHTGIPVVTTNYDRLIELAAEISGFGVDTLFVGHRAGKLAVVESRFGHCRGVIDRKVGRRWQSTLDWNPHLRVMKPHGSLDWFKGPQGPIACSHALNRQRLIITPGLNKYRGGYDPPFDSHREAANREIDRASRFLIIGYGFNDEHLQTHLEPKLAEGKPTILLTHSLSPKAISLIQQCPSILALSSFEDESGTKVITQTETHLFPGVDLWDLGKLVDEVLTPQP